MKQLPKILLVNLALLLLASSAVPAQEADGGKKNRPNILFIAIDDQNDWIG